MVGMIGGKGSGPDFFYYLYYLVALIKLIP